MAAMVFGLTWIVLVVWEIAAQPPDGEVTKDALSAEVSHAVGASDPVALQRLFLGNTGDDYASTFLDHLHEAAPTGVHVTPEGADIRLAAAASRNGPLCVRWRAVQLDERWVLDPTPDLAARC